MMFKIGDKVRFICEEKHIKMPQFYPLVGTIGVIQEEVEDSPFIQWEKGSTSHDDYWSAMNYNLELVEGCE